MPPTTMQQLNFRPFYVFKILFLSILILFVCNVVAFAAKQISTNTIVNKLIWLFDFNQEFNIPALYSSAALFFSSLLLFDISRNETLKTSKKLPWIVLAAIFFFLSIDELLSIHERLILFTRETLSLSGYFYFSWIVPYGIVTLLLGGIYLPFLLRLPKKIRVLFITSGFVFLTGAIGVEALGGRHFEAFGGETLQFFLYYTLEELLEMLGIAIFIYALLLYNSKHIQG